MDPDGEALHIIIGAVIGAVIGGVSAACAGGSIRQVAASAAGGAVLSKAASTISNGVTSSASGQKQRVFWSTESEYFAKTASGDVKALIGPNARQNSIWNTIEKTILKNNANVTSITEINPLE